MLKHDRENRKLKQRIKELEDQVAALEAKLAEAEDDSPTLIEDEIIVRLYQAITKIAEDTESPHHAICQEILEKTPTQIIDDVVEKYRREGVESAINLIKSKAEQARDLGSDLTAITAESLAEALEKLK